MLSSMKSIYDENKMIEPEKEVPIAPINAEKKRKMLEVTTAEPDNAKKSLPGRIATSSVESPNIIESTAFGPTVSYNLHKCLCRECREVVDTVTWKVNIRELFIRILHCLDVFVGGFSLFVWYCYCCKVSLSTKDCPS